ncbi:MAG TPA: DUF3180 domain-containing protein [Intrasporangium sp.]|uniref:DUF3180 domain-containing protein n=1 Tax=Intrasporangium sp. TaxID=1925024 RepID=UPI002D769113|nr:DUF3180 domain-containing protein [Intrasporangium sp.]HET7399457.1 DUF3180 domain-containing protein [Intrasporangium sp.]
MTPHVGLRASTLVLAAVATTLVGWLGLRWWVSGGGVPADPPWIGAVVMLFLAGGLLGAGWQVKKVRDGAAERHISPLRAARTLVLGQAGALTGALLVGWYVAHVLVLLPDSDVESQRGRIWPFLVHAGIAVLLAVAGMLVQWMCRVRRRDDEQDDDEAPLRA